jgi:transposase
MTDLTRVKQRLNHFLIRHGYHHTGCNWTEEHHKWINQIDFDNKILNNTLAHYAIELEFLNMQLKDLDREIEKIALSDEYKERVEALCAFRGIATLTAMIIISEVVDFSRFSNPRELMAYLGLVPSEYSSGGTVKKGSITKCGNKRVRRALIEAAHHYRHKPNISIKLKKDLEKVRSELRVAPVKALQRLHKKYYHMLFRGKPTQVTVTAVAREFCGFIWHNMVLIEKNRIAC